MNNMLKRTLSLALGCTLFASVAQAEEAISFPGVLSGTICYPETADEATASYVYRYSYPLAEGGSVAEAINANYAYMVYDAESFNVPITGESLEGIPESQLWTNVDASISCLSDDYVSVVVITTNDFGSGEYVICSSQTYPLSGRKSGSVTSLPYLLGILERNDEADEWLEERQAAKAEECVRTMVWEAIEEQIDDGEINFYDDLDYELLCAVFYPEDDFYLNADGDFVFYIQPDTIAVESEGILTYTFSLEEILDEL